LHPGGGAQHHVVDGAAPEVDRYRLPAERVAGSGGDPPGQHAAGNRVAEPLIGRVDRVENPDVGLDGAGELVRVVPGPALALLARAEVGVRVDEPGQHPPAGCVDHVHAWRRLEVRAAEGGDAAV